MGPSGKVKIFGKIYNVKSKSADIPIEEVAAYVDSKMKELTPGGKTKLSTADLAVLAALNIAGELLQLKGARTHREQDAEKRLAGIIEKLDKGLETLKTKGA